MNEGKDSDPLLQIYRPYKAELGTASSVTEFPLAAHFQTARLSHELAKIKWKHT